MPGRIVTERAVKPRAKRPRGGGYPRRGRIHRPARPEQIQESLSQDDALLAPIALYPDGLLMQVLMASTYPLEVVAADRFVKQNPGLQGDALDEALATKRWDTSLQPRAAYPRLGYRLRIALGVLLGVLRVWLGLDRNAEAVLYG